MQVYGTLGLLKMVAPAEGIKLSIHMNRHGVPFVHTSQGKQETSQTLGQ